MGNSDKLYQKAAELGILLSLPDYLTEEVDIGGGKTTRIPIKLKSGRLKSRMDTIVVCCVKELQNVPGNIITIEKKRIQHHLETLAKRNDWEGKPQHIATIVSFCLMFVDDSIFNYNPKIVSALRDIALYFERARLSGFDQYEEGKIANEIWEQIKGK